MEIYQQIAAYLKSKGHQVLTEHVVQPDVLELEKNFTAEQIYSRDIEWLRACDCVIAEVSNPSLGVGYEICYALRIDKPVLCLYQNGVAPQPSCTALEFSYPGHSISKLCFFCTLF